MPTSKKQNMPRKRPVQRRSQETVRVLRQAAAYILERDGLDKLTTNAIAARAGVNIGSLYQYFPNKEALLAELAAAHLADYVEHMREVEGATHALPLAESFVAMVGAHVRFCVRHGALHRALGQLDVITRGRVTTREHLAGLFAERLAACAASERARRDPETVARTAVVVVDALTHDAIESGRPLDDQRLVREIRAVLEPYLFGAMA